MGARIVDSSLYGHLWGTPESRAIFDESARLQGWLDVLVALARAQAEEGVIPEDAARAIQDGAAVERLDLDFVSKETRRTGHSTLGVIRGLQRVLPEEAREWVYYGATVQDVTDTWTATAIKRVGELVWRDLGEIEDACLELASAHRDTLMPGRTHGQTGAAITFGWKAAGWADEVRRHRERLREGRSRWLVCQLGDAVGTLAFFGDRGLAIRRRFAEHLGLAEPAISWTSARDRVAEFGGLLASVAAMTARIGNEIYQLQRPEIGELTEGSSRDTVGSITMPHKHNPEISEHLVTLARLVRASAQVLLEGMVTEHERDGRSWKAEWVALPEVCILTATSVAMGSDLVRNLEVNAETMRVNAEAGGWFSSEALLARLAPKLGKHRAQQLLQDVLDDAVQRGSDLAGAVLSSKALRDHLEEEEIAALIARPGTGFAAEMVNEVVRRAKEARAEEEDTWS